MTFLDVCAGIGGFSLGLERAGMTCAGQIEIDSYCNKILEKHWPDVQRWEDVKKITTEELPTVDLICGGYPCQPFSVAGKRQGEADDRYIWPHIRRIIDCVRPSWCLFENVAGHVSMGLDVVLSDMERLGYACWPLIIPACAVDAPHKRSRVWIISHTTSKPIRWYSCGELCEQRRHEARVRREDIRREDWEASPVISTADCQNVAHTNGAGRKKLHTTAVTGDVGHCARGTTTVWTQWETEPGICRVVDGIPRRVDRLRALGNAVVPQVVEVIGRAIMQSHKK